MCVVERSENAETESSEAPARWDFAAAPWDGLESSSAEMGSFAFALFKSVHFKFHLKFLTLNYILIGFVNSSVSLTGLILSF